ncbi:Chromate resistance protein ChrB [uncultured Phyllobacterium sp.]|uniref:Chromate resistance protein ChrB n=1 Tax=uncultured Phyllobacterium sp. TaxID=253813 RepID=UPI00338D5976
MPYAAFDKFTYVEPEENDDDLKKLRTWLGKIKALDVYQSPKGAEAMNKRNEREARLESFAQPVFAAQDENKPNSGPQS